MAYGESNGQVIDDATWPKCQGRDLILCWYPLSPKKLEIHAQYYLARNISKSVRDGAVQTPRSLNIILLIKQTTVQPLKSTTTRIKMAPSTGSKQLSRTTCVYYY